MEGVMSWQDPGCCKLTKPCIVKNMSGIICHKEIQAREEVLCLHIYKTYFLMFSRYKSRVLLLKVTVDSPSPKCLHTKFVSLLQVIEICFPHKSHQNLEKREDILLYMEENSKLSKNSKSQFKRAKLEYCLLFFWYTKWKLRCFTSTE